MAQMFGLVLASSTRSLPNWVEKEASAYAAAGHELGIFQFELPEKLVRYTERPAGTLQIEETDTALFIRAQGTEYVFDRVMGTLSSMIRDGKKLISRGPIVTVDRADIDNDMYKVYDWNNKYFVSRGMEQKKFTQKDIMSRCG